MGGEETFPKISAVFMGGTPARWLLMLLNTPARVTCKGVVKVYILYKILKICRSGVLKCGTGLCCICAATSRNMSKYVRKLVHTMRGAQPVRFISCAIPS